MPRETAAGSNKDMLVNHCQLVTQDLDRAREFVSRVWERHVSHLRRGHAYGLRWHQAELTHSTLAYLRSPSRIDVDCGRVSNAFRITMHEAGCLHHRINGYETTSTPGRAVVHAPWQELRLVTEPFRILLLTLDGDFVQRAMARRFESIRPFEAWARALPMNSLAATSLRALSRWMARELDRPDRGVLSSARAVAGLEQTLLTLLLDCLADQYPDAQPRANDITAARLARVEEWIEANFSEPVTVDDLALVAGTGVRAVQNAFRRFRGCTPIEAVNSHRLKHAREALRSGAPQTTVTTVATDVGFFHLGRFATRYHHLFGETPSQTLARARDVEHR